MRENAELRRQVEDLMHEYERLGAENGKLREFAQAVAEEVYYDRILDCGQCRFFQGCYNGQPKEHEGRGCQWLLWSRELGVEVGL